MPRPRLHSPDQPWPVRWLLKLYQFSASLPLAIVLLSAYTLVLIWATFIEGRYGTPAAAFGIYESWWFAALHGLLAFNVLCAALIRIPWKRHQIGFLVTHLGILVLMLGCLVTWWGGVRATLPIFEGHSSWQAFEDAQHFELLVQAEGDEAEDEPRPVVVPFRGGPFNWSDYGHLPAFPWHWVPRDAGVLYDSDDIRLEVLDYYSDSAVEQLPFVSLRTSDLPAWRRAVQIAGAAPWKAVALSGMSPRESPHDEGMPLRGGRAAGRGDERFLLWTARTAEETDAFLRALPRGVLGAKGQVVLRTGAKNYYISVDEKLEQPRFPLGDTGLEVQVVGFIPQYLAVRLQVFPGKGKDDAPREPQDMVLLADMPDMNRQTAALGVFGYFWFDAKGEMGELLAHGGGRALIQEASRPRIDLLQGHDRKLYCRTWLSPHAVAAGELTADGTPLTLLREVGAPVTVCVDYFAPRSAAAEGVAPLPFRNAQDENRLPPQPRTRVRLTVDGRPREFWLAAKPMQAPPFSERPEAEKPDYRETVAGDGRCVQVTFARDAVDLGFRVYLNQFDKRLVPGTREAEGYSSWIEMLDRDEDKRITEAGRRGEETTLNAPVTFRDPESGRAFRLYQSSYRAVPLRPGEGGFDILATGTSRPHVFLSYLTANYDPGRGLKYAGCLVIVVGIAIVFYMKAYFFRRPRRAAAATLVLAVLISAAPARAGESDGLDWTTWQHIPVFGQGRVMPLDTFARSVVRKVCGRENPRLDLDGATYDDENAERQATELQKLFPGGQPRKFSAAELLFSWLVERERWQDVPLFSAEHEALRREVLKLPTADAEGRRLKRVSARQLEEAAAFQERRADLDRQRARAHREQKEFSPAGLDEQVAQLGTAADAFAVLAFQPEGDTLPQESFVGELREALKTWTTLSRELQGWFDLVNAEPRIDQSDRWQDTLALHRSVARSAAGLDAVLRDQEQEEGKRRFTLAAVLPLTVEFRKSAGELAAQLAGHRQRLQKCPKGVSEAQWTSAADRLRNLAALGDRLARQARHLPVALYDNVWSDETSMGLQLRRLRVMPTGASAAKGDEEEEIARPWISLQAVLLAPDAALADYPAKEIQEVRASFAAAAKLYRDRDAYDRTARFNQAMQRFVESLRKLGKAVDSDAYPRPGALNLEVRYNRFDPFLWAWITSLAALGCFALCFGVLRKPMFWIGMSVLVLAQAIVLLGLVLRTSISGWVSVTNMFESVVFVSLSGATLGTFLALAPLLWPGLKIAWSWTAIPGTWEARRADATDAAPPQWTAGRGILVGLRALLGGGVVFAASFATLGPGGKGQIISLLPKVASGASLPTVNDFIVWIVGVCLLAFAVWGLPRLILAVFLSVAAVPKAWAKSGLSEPMRDTLARRPFAMAGAVVCFLAAYLAYYAPVFKKDIPSLTAALRDNFWLTFHVVPIMASYAAGALAWGLANLAVLHYLLGRYGKRTVEAEAADEEPAGDDGTVPVLVSANAGLSRSAPAVCAPVACDALGRFTYRAMQVAVLLLIAGTILGALWADVVWGRFWSWDRKEVWSLVSIMVYMVILHGRSARWFGNFGLAVGSVVGFTAIVMTWYGLNYVLPGGLHTYGRGEGGILYVGAAVLCNWLLAAAAVVRYNIQARRARKGTQA